MYKKDADLRRLAGYNIKRASGAIMAGVNRTLAPFGLRHTTYSALSVIAASPGLKQVDLSEILAIERPNLVQIIDELEAAALITRTRSAGDRRAYELHVTLPGRRKLQHASAALTDFDARLTDGLTDLERDLLITALQRVEGNGAGLAAEEEGDARNLSAP